MDLRHLTHAAAAMAVLALPTAALAAPDENSNGPYNNGQYNNQCVQWNNNGQCVRWNNRNGNGNNGNWNNGNWNNGNDERGRGHGRDRGDREDRNGNDNNGYGNNGGWNNGYGNNGGWNNGYGRNGYGRGGALNGSVSSFSPYNLYLSNGTHVSLHNGTVINPTGINLSPGMRVHITGNWNNDGTFNANQIDVAGRGYNPY